MKTNAAQAIMRVNDATDAVSARRRLPLNLPAPQVSDQELEEIVKMGHADAEEGHEATQDLVGNYRERPTPTPLRTPRAAEDVILQEAKNQARMRSAPTPLHGEELPDTYEAAAFGGITPLSSKVVTPNVLASPARHSGKTPLRGGASTRQAFGSKYHCKESVCVCEKLCQPILYYAMFRHSRAHTVER